MTAPFSLHRFDCVVLTVSLFEILRDTCPDLEIFSVCLRGLDRLLRMNNPDGMATLDPYDEAARMIRHTDAQLDAAILTKGPRVDLFTSLRNLKAIGFNAIYGDLRSWTTTLAAVLAASPALTELDLSLDPEFIDRVQFHFTHDEGIDWVAYSIDFLYHLSKAYGRLRVAPLKLKALRLSSPILFCPHEDNNEGIDHLRQLTQLDTIEELCLFNPVERLDDGFDSPVRGMSLALSAITTENFPRLRQIAFLYLEDEVYYWVKNQVNATFGTRVAIRFDEDMESAFFPDGEEPSMAEMISTLVRCYTPPEVDEDACSEVRARTPETHETAMGREILLPIFSKPLDEHAISEMRLCRGVKTLGVRVDKTQADTMIEALSHMPDLENLWFMLVELDPVLGAMSRLTREENDFYAEMAGLSTNDGGFSTHGGDSSTGGSAAYTYDATRAQEIANKCPRLRYLKFRDIAHAWKVRHDEDGTATIEKLEAWEDGLYGPDLFYDTVVSGRDEDIMSREEIEDFAGMIALDDD